MEINDDTLCQCGHRADEHHASYFFGASEFAGSVWREECEKFGYNETGGMEYVEGTGWIEHCQRFRLLPQV